MPTELKKTFARPPELDRLGVNAKPSLDQRAICITNDSRLAAIISSFFFEAGRYFSLFTFPPVDESIFSQVLTHRFEVFIHNRIRFLRPTFVILAGLTEEQKSFFTATTEYKVIIIDEEDHLVRMDQFGVSFSGEISVNPNSILQGLYTAKIQQKRLVVKDEAPHTNVPAGHGVDLVVIEKGLDVYGVTAINYAFSIGADISLISKVSQTEVDVVRDQLHRFDETKDNKHRSRIIEKLNRKIKGIPFDRYNTATFVTEGLPYGYSISNIITSCHVYRRGATETFFDNIYVEGGGVGGSIGTALVFSPEVFLETAPLERVETEHLLGLLQQRGFFIKLLSNKDATVRNLDNYVQFFPFDLLHICSHGGRVPSYYVRMRFKDQRGIDHIVEYYEVATFSLIDEIGKDGKPMVSVMTKNIFYKLDGYRWASSELKRNRERYVFNDLLLAMSPGGNERVLEMTRVSTDYHPPSSARIQCYDSIHQGSFQSLSGMGTPIVFNNSCESWLEMAKNFLQCGARAYIGTLWSVKNNVAKESAESFYSKTLEHGLTLAESIRDVNTQITDQRDKNIYIYWGVHFAKIPSPRESLVDIRSRLLGRLVRSYNNYRSKFEDRGLGQDVRRNSAAVMRFLLSCGINDVGGGMAVSAADMKRFQESEEAQQAEEELHDEDRFISFPRRSKEEKSE